jgi:hypothetical protein
LAQLSGLSDRRADEYTDALFTVKVDNTIQLRKKLRKYPDFLSTVGVFDEEDVEAVKGALQSG